MTRAEYQAAMRDVSKLAARTEIKAARRVRAVTREALAPVVAEIARGKKPSGIDKPKLAEAITGVIKAEGAKPVEKIREVRRGIEESLAAKFGVPIPKAAATVRNARQKAQTEYRTGGAYGRVLSGKRVSAYTKDPETGKITWNDKVLEYAFTKRYDLSALIWASVEDMEAKIFDVINGGLALGRDPVDIARDLETYISYENGGERVLGRWGAMFPKTDEGRYAAWKREYLAFHDIQPGSDEARKLFPVSYENLTEDEIAEAREAKDWVKKMMAEKTQRGTPLLPDAVKQYARRIGKAGLDYRAIRIVRTETARMVADEEADFAKNSYAATGQVDWILKSGREQWGCSCAEYAKGGPYMIDNLPAEIPVHPNCFVPWARVLTPHGYRRIDSLREGDDVIGGDGYRHRVLKIMGRLYEGPVYKPVEYSGVLREGDYSTPEHPYNINGVWKPLVECDELSDKFQYINRFRILRRILHLPVFSAVEVYLSMSSYKGFVYNLEVEDCHSYIVAGYVVHNCDCELRPRLKSDAELKATFKALMGEE